MKITYNWLKELVDIQASADEVASRLTLTGLEVESVEKRAIPQGIVVAEVLEVSKHPNAEKLSLCSVSIGKEEPLQIVCGAPNVKAGMRSALATIGTKLAPDFTVKKAKLRGVESFGMLCSEKELGISEDHEGIMSLSDDFVVGNELSSYLPDDYIIEIDLTPNRGDCLSMLGVAREVAAQFNAPLKPAAKHPTENSDSTENYITVSIEDAEGCPRYAGRMVKGVTIKESPLWLKNRLSALDIRPISNVVDITNYILLLFGQPMHSFDYATIAGQKIIVKRAIDGQTFTTLDDIERNLIADDLLICDEDGPTALAGVMGGAGSGITEKTADVFLECAFFNPVGVRKTSKRLDLSTDSSYRFERGVDPESGLIDAIDTAAALIQELAGGEVTKDIIDVYPKPIAKRKVTLRPSQVARVLGVPIPKEQIVQYCTTLQIICTKDNDTELEFEVPQFRHDITMEVDLIEEVGRLYGYDNIPTSDHASVGLNKHPNTREAIVDTIRKSLAGLGLRETVTNSMSSEKKLKLLHPELEPVKLLNPLNPDMACLRTTLLGSLLEVTAYNSNRKNSNNALYELGKIYLHQGENVQPKEPETLALLLEGAYLPASWNTPTQELNFFILKGILETLQSSLKLSPFTYKNIDKNDRGFFTEESAQVSGDGIIGLCGKVSPAIAKSFDIKTPVYYAQLDITELLTNGAERPLYSALPRYPAIERDFSFVMDDSTLSSAIQDEMYTISDLVSQVQPFDVYRGDKLPEGKKSIAYSIHLRAGDRTLTDKEAEKVCTAIISTVKSKFGATLRE